MDPAEVQQVIDLIANAEYPSGYVLSSAVKAPMYRGLPSAAQVSMYHCLPSATQSPMYRGLPSAAQVSMYRCLPSATQPPNRGSEAPPDGHRLAAVFMHGLQQMARDTSLKFDGAYAPAFAQPMQTPVQTPVMVVQTCRSTWVARIPTPQAAKSPPQPHVWELLIFACSPAVYP